MQSLPLLGGRNGSAHAAGVIELLCTPPAPSPSASDAGGGSSSASTSAGKKDGSGGKASGTKQSRTSSASSSKGSGSAAGGGGGGGDASLTTALQQGVLAAGGLPALIQVCAVCCSPCLALLKCTHMCQVQLHYNSTAAFTKAGLTAAVEACVGQSHFIHNSVATPLLSPLRRPAQHQEARQHAESRLSQPCVTSWHLTATSQP